MFLMVYSMANLMVFFIWTSMILTSAFCLTQKQEELAAKEPATAPPKNTRRTELTWINSDKITTPTTVMKTHNSPIVDKKDIENFCCGFSNCVTKFQNTPEKEFIFNNIEDTVAKNFSCRVYNVSFMNCTWIISRTAPNDVQYYLFSQNFRREQEKECTSYIEDSQKRHVGCHFDDLNRFKGKAYFLVTGTSKRKKIKNFCSEKISLLSIEIFNPPSNITVNCSDKNCLIQWQKPKTRIMIKDEEFSYELDIQRQDSQYSIHDQPLILKGQNEYDFQNYDKATKYILKIKSSRRNLIWGDWSEPIEFGGTGKQKMSSLYIYILVVLGTVIFVLIIMFIFKRYFVIQRLFPRIPQIKDKVNSCSHLDKQINWEEFKHYPEKYEEIMTIDVIERCQMARGACEVPPNC